MISIRNTRQGNNYPINIASFFTSNAVYYCQEIWLTVMLHSSSIIRTSYLPQPYHYQNCFNFKTHCKSFIIFISTTPFQTFPSAQTHGEKPQFILHLGLKQKTKKSLSIQYVNRLKTNKNMYVVNSLAFLCYDLVGSKGIIIYLAISITSPRWTAPCTYHFLEKTVL